MRQENSITLLGLIEQCFRGLTYSLDHILYNFLSITKDHHGFIHVEELVIKTSKNRDLEQYKKEQEKLNLFC